MATTVAKCMSANDAKSLEQLTANVDCKINSRLASAGILPPRGMGYTQSRLQSEWKKGENNLA
jgi:hypothetical protein